MPQQLVFQLGTNNWQRDGEFAPGSGILHEAHHAAYAAIPDTSSYSIYPSSSQTSSDPTVKILELSHEVPICESISPVSSYRFHAMSDEEFDRYREKLKQFTEQTIDAAEQAEGVPVSVAIAHHSFLNPWILSEINQQREANGRPRFKLICFVHGTALKMFAHEKEAVDPEYPLRFLPLIRDAGVFGANSGIDICAAISNEQIGKFRDVFDEYPAERMLLSPNGYSSNAFFPDPEAYARRQDILATTSLADSPVASAPTSIATRPDKCVVFCGKFADWKRLDAVLHAATEYEKDGNIATLIIGSGPDEAIAHYHDLAYSKLKLSNCFFLGARQHADIARFNSLSDIGVFPSRNEPFGLVFIECMACGTPVIGADSGGPRDFVTAEVGGLIPESEGQSLVDSLLKMIRRALTEDWKATKGPVAADYARNNFSTATQCEGLLNSVRRELPAHYRQTGT